MKKFALFFLCLSLFFAPFLHPWGKEASWAQVTVKPIGQYPVPTSETFVRGVAAQDQRVAQHQDPSSIRALSLKPLAGGVATQHPLATQTGIKILKKGGNAVDAAVAAALTLAVVEPYNSGLGAGGLAMVWDPEKKRGYPIDFRERAPLKATPKLFQRPGVAKDASKNGPLAIAVPGEIAGLAYLHRRWGRLPWKDLFVDAIQYAEQGFVADSALLDRTQGRQACLSRDYHSWKVYRPLLKPPSDLAPNPSGNPQKPEAGQVPTPPPRWIQGDLAQTLKVLRDEGAKSFYQGPLGFQLVSNLKGKGSLITLADLRTYEVKERNPIIGNFDWGRVWGFPLPSSGGISVVRALNTLEAIQDKTKDWDNWQAWLVKVLGPIFADRNAEMGDEDFVSGQPVARWVSHSFAKAQAKELLKEDWLPKATPRAQAQKQTETDGQTTHLSVMDSEGRAVSLTLTQNLSFGSCVTAGSTGILMNNQMDDFATRPGQPNAFGLVQGMANGVEPGKRPLSSMSPTLVTGDDQVILAIGSPGGPRIITSVLQVLYRHFILQQDLRQAIAAPRLHYQGLPRRIFLETGFSAADQAKLRQLKLPLKPSSPWSNVQAVAYDPQTGRFSAFSDPRGIGAAQTLQRSQMAQ